MIKWLVAVVWVMYIIIKTFNHISNIMQKLMLKSITIDTIIIKEKIY